MKKLLDIVEETLQITGELSAKEIWKKAHELGTIGDFITRGKTPVNTISAHCYLDVKNRNGNSRFKLSGHPIKIGLNKNIESEIPNMKKEKCNFEEFRTKFNINKYRQIQVKKLRNCAKVYIQMGDLKKSGLDKYPAFIRCHEYTGSDFLKMCNEIIIGDVAPFAIIKTQEYGENGPYMSAYFESNEKNFEKITPSFFSEKYGIKINQSYSPRWTANNSYIMGIHIKWGGKTENKIEDFFKNELPKLIETSKKNSLKIWILWYCNVDKKSNYGKGGYDKFIEEIEKFKKLGITNINFCNFDDIETLPL